MQCLMQAFLSQPSAVYCAILVDSNAATEVCVLGATSKDDRSVSLAGTRCLLWHGVEHEHDAKGLLVMLCRGHHCGVQD
jgi:hypothetical protein